MTKSKFVKIAVVALILALSLTALCSCGEKAMTDFGETTDKMRTYYQIFPYSFADSNGDGIGDFNGITAKLDYIADMNFEGVWLTPIHSSPTYHKYDVLDYKSVDKSFGTIEDYDNLVRECHKRGMTVLLDLVINHTAKANPWLEKCYGARVRNKKDDQYYNYYNLKKRDGNAVIPAGWEVYSGDWIYECQFGGGMPDLNLQNVLDEPNGYLAAELKEIMRFWLIDRNVDGFRLDAVTSYFTGNNQNNKAILTWINDTAKSIKPDCYIVGEGAWGNVEENKTYHESGVDSFFAFQHGFTGNGTLSYAVRLEKAFYLENIDKTNKENVAGGIPAMFIANHDTARAWGILQGGSDVNNVKMGYGLMTMCYGTTFWYYGDEIGMNVYANSGDKIIDENRRQPLPWGDNYTCKPAPASSSASFSVKYPLGTVAENLKDKSSIINYITRANALRRSFPQIARNYGESVYLSEDGLLAIVKKGTGADAVYVVMNVSHSYTLEYDLSALGGKFKLAGTLSVDKTPSLKGGKLIMPKQSFAILQQG